jgi:hypothetical protein
MEIDQDGVNIAFDFILEELGNVIEQLRDEGANLFKRGQYDDAKKLGVTGKDLDDFKVKLASLQGDWNKGFDRETRELIKTNRVKKLTNNKSKKTVLSVSFSDGKIYQNSVAAETFVAALKEMGLEAVKKLGIKISSVPLIWEKKHEKYNQHRSGNYFVMTHSSTQNKKETLEQVAKSLGHKIQVKIVHLPK